MQGITSQGLNYKRERKRGQRKREGEDKKSESERQKKETTFVSRPFLVEPKCLI